MSTLPQTRWPVQHESVASHTAPSCWDADSHGFNWYAVYTLTRHEKRVMAQCEERQIEAFLPLYKTRHLWKNRCTVDLELPLFPNYSFVPIDPRQRPQALHLPRV